MDSFAKIRQQACQKMPFAIRAFFSLTPVASRDVPVSPTCDAYWRVYYNPDEVERFNDADLELAALRLCREVARLLQGHPKRLSELLPKQGKHQTFYRSIGNLVSNTLCNFLVGAHTPDSFAHPAELPGCNAIANDRRQLRLELLYPRVVKALGPPPESDDDDGDSGQSNQDEKEDSQSDSSGSQSKQKPKRSDDMSDPDSQEGGQQQQQQQQQQQHLSNALPQSVEVPNPDESGSSLDGQQRSWELPPPENNPSGSPLDNVPVNETAICKQASSAMRTMGHTGGGQAQKDWAIEALERRAADPPRDILSLIRDFAETHMGYEMRRFDGRNRRQYEISRYNNADIYLPHYYAPKVDILIVLDTSGSMTQDLTTTAMVYIASVIDSLSLNEGAHFYTGDTCITYQGLLNRNTVKDKSIVGGGGTSMPRVIWDAYEHHVDSGRNCNLVLCVTDGMTPWRFERILPVPLIIAMVPTRDYETASIMESEIRDPGGRLDQPPEWAEYTFVTSDNG